jgi:hypothetical protein
MAADEPKQFHDLWSQILDVTQAGTRWTEESFVSPPWKDILFGQKDGRSCAITAPMELR